MKDFVGGGQREHRPPQEGVRSLSREVCKESQNGHLVEFCEWGGGSGGEHGDF